MKSKTKSSSGQQQRQAVLEHGDIEGKGGGDIPRLSQRDDWLLDVIVPKSKFPQPDWVRRCILDLVQSCHPTETWRTRQKLASDPREQGAAVGHAFASCRAIRFHLDKLTPSQRKMVGRVYVNTGKFVERAVAKPLYGPHPTADCVKFFRGFVGALEKGSINEKGAPTSLRGDELTFQIKLAMYVNWKKVQSLRAQPGGIIMVRDYIQTKLPLKAVEQQSENPKLADDLKERIRVICRRWGLKGKRGRAPKKNK